MDTPLEQVLELIEQLSDFDRQQVIDYLDEQSETTSVNHPPASSETQSEQLTLKQKWAKWLEETENTRPEPPKELTGHAKEYEEALVEKYRRQGLRL